MPDPSKETLPPARRAALIAARDRGTVWQAAGFCHSYAFTRLVGRMLVDGLLRSDGSLTERGRAVADELVSA